MSHRQQKRGATLKFGGFLTYAMEMYNLEPADKPQLAHLEKMFQHLPASGTMKLNCVFKAPKNPRRETAMCIPKYKVPCKEHVWNIWFCLDLITSSLLCPANEMEKGSDFGTSGS